MEADILLQKITFLLKRRAKGDRLTEIVQNPPKHILSEHTSGVEQNGATFLLKLLLARQVDIKLSSVALVLLYRGMEKPGKPCFIRQTTEDTKWMRTRSLEFLNQSTSSLNGANKSKDSHCLSCYLELPWGGLFCWQGSAYWKPFSGFYLKFSTKISHSQSER